MRDSSLLSIESPSNMYILDQEDVVTLIDQNMLQQLLLLSVILSGFSLPLLSQLLREDNAEAGVKRKARAEMPSADEAEAFRRLPAKSIIIVLVMIAIQALLISALIGLSLYLAQQNGLLVAPGRVTREGVTIISLAYKIWQFLLIGALLMLSTVYCMLAWCKSRILGIVSIVGVLGAISILVPIWTQLG